MSSAVTYAALGQLQRLVPGASFRVISTTTTKCVSDKRFDSTEEMVSTSPLPLRKSKGSRPWDSSTSAWGRRKHFVDWMKVRVKAGDGGDGRINLMHRYRIDHAGVMLCTQGKAPGRRHGFVDIKSKCRKLPKWADAVSGHWNNSQCASL